MTAPRRPETREDLSFYREMKLAYARGYNAAIRKRSEMWKAGWDEAVKPLACGHPHACGTGRPCIMCAQRGSEARTCAALVRDLMTEIEDTPLDRPGGWLMGRLEELAQAMERLA